MTIHKLDPKLDLVLERVVDVPPALVWEAWTKPEHLRHWFTPKPWTVAHCEVDLRPGGTFRTVMRGPDGEEHDVAGCYLEVVPQQQLICTDALMVGLREFPAFVLAAIVELEPAGKGTRYRATAIHRDEDGRKKHEEMGFHQGWGTVLDQLVEYAKAM